MYFMIYPIWHEGEFIPHFVVHEALVTGSSGVIRAYCYSRVLKQMVRTRDIPSDILVALLTINHRKLSRVITVVYED